MGGIYLLAYSMRFFLFSFFDLFIRVVCKYSSSNYPSIARVAGVFFSFLPVMQHGIYILYCMYANV